MKTFWQNALDQKGIQLFGRFITNSDQSGLDFAHGIRKALVDIKVDAIYCIQNVPHFAILEQPKYDREEILRIYAALWNQCLCSLLVVVTPDYVHMFSLAKSIRTEEENNIENFCLLKKVEIDDAKSVFEEYVYRAVSGRIWREETEDFDFRERIDHVLLENLKFSSKKLESTGLNIDESQAILIQTMLIAYLEDRGIIAEDYFMSVSENTAKSFAELLEIGNATQLGDLFKQLKSDFNGDLLVAPCSFENVNKSVSLSSESMKILAEFRLGNIELASGQFRLFGYNFRYIPIELISSVYDQFLSTDKNTKKESGAFYTPVPLVEITLSSIWEFLSEKNKKNGNFLDPACGSGIFLVRCFQWMCEYHRSHSNSKNISWNELNKLVNRLHGWDLNKNAVRIAVFSLYIALLDETSTKNIEKLIREDCKLPKLWNNTLISEDYFKEAADNISVDVIFGNPSWSKHSGLESTALNWCKKNNHRASNNQIAWPFIWKAMKNVNKGGMIAFLLPSNDLLYSTAIPVKDRNSFYWAVELKRIVDFSDFRKQLFEYSSQPVALIAFAPKIKPLNDYDFEFWMPKATRNPKVDRFLNINSIDKADLRFSYVVKNQLAFKQFAWMREPERKLFAYLNRLPKLSGNTGSNETNTESEVHNSDVWRVGRGFQLTNESNLKTKIPSRFKEMIKSRYLDIRKFKPFSITSDSLEKFSWENLSRRGCMEVYSGPRIIVSRGIRPTTNRLCVDYVEKAFAIKGQIIGIKNLEGQIDLSKLLAGLLSSRLATWFFFHSSGSLGVSLPMITQAELLRFPFPSADEFSDEVQSERAAKDIVKLVDKVSSGREINDPIVGESTKLFSEIDRLTYEYFCLTADEISLIEDSVKYVISSIHPSAVSQKLLWEGTDYEIRSKYAHKLKSSLENWFEDPVGISVETVGMNKDVAILKLSLCDATEAFDYIEIDNMKVIWKLAELIQDSNYEVHQHEIFDLKHFHENELYMVKPLQRRFWLESSAIADADEIVVELEKSVEYDTIKYDNAMNIICHEFPDL